MPGRFDRGRSGPMRSDMRTLRERRRRPRRRAAWALATLLAACGGAPTTPQRATVTDPAPRASAEPRASRGEGASGLERLADDIVAGLVCDGLGGQFAPLDGAGGRGTGEGRLWIRRCRAEVRGRVLHVEVEATLWSWVEREESAAGATFELSQYVALATRVVMDARVRTQYVRARRLAYIHVEPAEPPWVEVEAVGDIDVDPQGLWGEIVGGVAGVFSDSPSERARVAIEEQGRTQLEAALARGITVVFDLCTAQPRTILDPLAGERERGEPEPPAVRPGARRWVDRQRARLHASGLDAAGPYRPGARPVQVRVEVTEGSPVRARLVSDEDAARMVEAWLERGLDAVPDVTTFADERVTAGETATLRADTQRRVVVVTTPEGDAGASSLVELTASGVHRHVEQLVPGCRDKRPD